MSSLFTVPELVIGVGLSEAASSAFEPKVEVPKQAAWVANPQRVPDLGLIAALVAGGKVSMADGSNMANRLGFSSGTMESLVWLAQNRLDFPLMLRMWRLAAVNPAFDEAALDALFDKTIAHEQLDWDYRPYLRALRTAELIGLGDIATAIVRGAVPAPSWVPVAPPTTTDNVPRFPVTDVDPVQLAAALGFDENMLRIMTARSGLSLAPILATQAFFRGALTQNDWLLAIAEGDLRTEWAETLKAAARVIPSARDGVQKHLRGWTDAPGMYAITARHGMTQADTDTLFQIERRPLNIHAITTGLARGGQFNPQPGELTDPYAASSHQSDLGPEWYDLNEANKYVYPSAFVLRSLAQAGDLGGQAEVEQVLLEIGWKPSFATSVSTAWTHGTATGDSHVSKAQTQLWGTAHKSYLAYEITDADATSALEAAGVAAASIPAVLTIWQHERALIRKGLSATQVKKAYTSQTTNPATGVAWTLQDATARLLELGYDQADATVLLEE